MAHIINVDEEIRILLNRRDVILMDLAGKRTTCYTFDNLGISHTFLDKQISDLYEQLNDVTTELKKLQTTEYKILDTDLLIDMLKNSAVKYKEKSHTDKEYIILSLEEIQLIIDKFLNGANSCCGCNHT